MTHTSTAQHLTAIDLLRARDFPARPTRSAMVESGPGFHIAQLRAGEPFWDADPADVRETAEEFRDELEGLISALCLRWGEPEVLDLSAHLERAAMGMPVPPPLDSLCGYVPRVYAWRADGRWVAVGLGQGEPDLPFQLLAAVAAADTVR
ncbi:hypothetical protein [Streptomyces sp. MST-110588]|uniref:hypothetical protein n=1 Tax=Streptomyces sp. MST-110588 TaxID=2833628 RepID=UPI001F5D3EE3|nr:hypothetical protein [Streptomyces sp. MST-110588]UNO38628.1 hypothetical protein KGS77_01925 [Streptomyces sp. MST-110588]